MTLCGQAATQPATLSYSPPQ